MGDFLFAFLEGIGYSGVLWRLAQGIINVSFLA